MLNLKFYEQIKIALILFAFCSLMAQAQSVDVKVFDYHFLNQRKAEVYHNQENVLDAESMKKSACTLVSTEFKESKGGTHEVFQQ